MPNRWEVLGGGCGDEDESILHGVARELWEEAGFKATCINALVGDPHFFIGRSGKRICKFHFMAQAETGVGRWLEINRIRRSISGLYGQAKPRCGRRRWGT